MSSMLTRSLAFRYFRGKRSANAVPILSRISMGAITVGSCALIVLLSVFNGLEHLVKDMYKCFYPDIKITAARGKFFSPTEAKPDAIRRVAGVQYIAPVIEDNVLAYGADEQLIAVLKGVDSNYFHVSEVKSYIASGRDSISDYPVPTAILGQNLANMIGADVNNVFSAVTLFYLNTKLANPALNPEEAYQQVKLKPDGTFEVADEFDTKYILAPIPVARQLFGEEGKVSSLEIALSKDTDPKQVQAELRKICGNSFRIATRYEQNETLYSMMRTEKRVMFAILVLVLFIASFNMVGALSLLVMEKAKDIAILKAMGAMPNDIRRVFVLEGLLWSLTGGVIGLALGWLLCFGQERFGWVKPGGSFAVAAFPVQMQAGDFILVLATIMVVGFCISIVPAMRAIKVSDPGLKSA